MKCKCGAEVENGYLYCGECGRQIRCSNCGAELSENDLFCGNCGTGIQRMPIKPEFNPQDKGEGVIKRRRRNSQLDLEDSASDDINNSSKEQMTQKAITEYVGILADMENNIYLQDSIIQKLKIKSQSLVQPRNIPLPISPAENRSIYNLMPEKAKILLFCICTLLCIFLCYCGKLTTENQGFIFKLIGFAMIAGGIYLIFGCFTKIAAAYKGIKNKKNCQTQASEAKKHYEFLVSQYHIDIKLEETRMKNEEHEKQFIDLEIQTAESRLEESKQRLKSMYGLDIISPKYRNMTMINTIYEYLKSGRCLSLYGPSGAYDTIERESRMDAIILQLDRINRNLEKIKQNQYTLYQAIERGNSMAMEIVNSTESLSKQLDNMNEQQKNYSQEIRKLQASSSLTAYNTERINKELEYMNRMNYFSGNYDRVFYNQLP